MPIRDSSRRPKHRKKTDDKLDLEERTHASNLGGMLSSLSAPSEEARRRQQLCSAIEAERASGSVGLNTTVADASSRPDTDDRSDVVGSFEDHFPSLPGEISLAVDGTAAGHDSPTVVDLPTVGRSPILFTTKPAQELLRILQERDNANTRQLQTA